MKANPWCNCENCQHQLCVSRVPIFSGLAPEDLSKVAALIAKKKYDKGELIMLEGSFPDNLIIINRGQVKVFRYTSEGKEQILYMFAEGDFFGEKNLLKNQEATYNVEALGSTDLCMINKQDFQKLLREYPGIGIKIMEELICRMEKMEDALQSMGTKSMEARVNNVLVEFAGKYGKKHVEGLLVTLPLSREGIASYIGAARETVSRKLNALQEEGIIRMIGNKKILIKDINALEG